MAKFTVTLSKDYANEAGDLIRVEGEMEVEARSQLEAEEQVEEMMGWHPDGVGVRTLQTLDPRIEWEQDCQGLADESYEYVDFSFGVVRGEAAISEEGLC